MKVYRLERNSVGPYMGKAPYYRHGSQSPEKTKRRLHQYNQVRISMKDHWSKHTEATNSGYIFGAKSKELLKAYFSYNLKPYFADGYRIKTYDIPDDLVINMGHEVAFPRPEKQLDI